MILDVFVYGNNPRNVSMKSMVRKLNHGSIGRVHLDSLELYPNTLMKKDTLIDLMPEKWRLKEKTVYEGTPDPTL